MRLALKMMLIVFSELGYTSSVKGFPTGAPYDTCLAMYPKHSGLEKQKGPAPYVISLSSATYRPGQNISLTVRATEGRKFRGIQTNARRADVNRQEIVGTFIDWPSSKVKVLNCFLATHNMITHNNNEDVTQVQLVWRAPDVNMGPIIFRVTLAENFTVFWHEMTSPRLEAEDPSSVVPPALQAERVNTNFSPIDWSECGKTKGCLLYPRQCSRSDCYAAVTFTRTSRGYTFELVGEGEGYVSVGLSHDKKMGDDQTVSCTAQGERVTVQNGYNHDGLWNERQMGLELRDLETKQEDGKIYCRFTRPEVMDVVYYHAAYDPPEVKTFDLQTDFYIFLAWGYTYQDTDVMKIHTELPVISETKVNFRRYVIHRGSVMSTLKQIHASLMVVAWVAMAGLTTVLSRHFREGSGAHYVCGLPVWFQLHRLCGMLVFFLTAAGLVLILLLLKGKVTENKAAYSHACVGFTVAALVCVQVVSGLLRPSRDSAGLRTVYNYVHLVLGKLTQILSAVALLLAFQWDWQPRIMREMGVMVLAVWIALQVLSELLLEIRRCWYIRRTKVVDINLDNEPTEKQEIRRDPSSVPVMLYLLVPLAAGSAGLCCVLLF